MKWLTILYIFIVHLLPFNLSAQYSVVPSIRQSTTGEGSFTLSANCQWDCNAPDTALVNLFTIWVNQIKTTHITPGKTVQTRLSLLLIGNKNWHGYLNKLGLDAGFLPGNQGYILRIEKHLIQVIAQTSQGLFYGFQTMSQLFRLDEIHSGIIYDKPVSEIRGWTESGNIKTQEDINRLCTRIQKMARFKFNQIGIPEHILNSIETANLNKITSTCRNSYIRLISLPESFTNSTVATMQFTDRFRKVVPGENMCTYSETDLINRNTETENLIEAWAGQTGWGGYSDETIFANNFSAFRKAASIQIHSKFSGAYYMEFAELSWPYQNIPFPTISTHDHKSESVARLTNDLNHLMKLIKITDSLSTGVNEFTETEAAIRYEMELLTWKLELILASEKAYETANGLNDPDAFHTLLDQLLSKGKLLQSEYSFRYANLATAESINKSVIELSSYLTDLNNIHYFILTSKSTKGMIYLIKADLPYKKGQLIYRITLPGKKSTKDKEYSRPIETKPGSVIHFAVKDETGILFEKDYSVDQP